MLNSGETYLPIGSEGGDRVDGGGLGVVGYPVPQVVAKVWQSEAEDASGG